MPAILLTILAEATRVARYAPRIMTTLRTTLITLLFATTALAGTRVATDAPCASGVWAIDGGPLAVGPLAISAIALRDGEPSIDASCRALRWHLVRVEGTVRLRALFVCQHPEGDQPRRRFALRLRARLVEECARMEGAFGLRRLGLIVRFTATRTVLDCASNDDCREDAYCAKEPGRCAARGSCAPRPSACPDNVEPVCGCNGVTYSNPCDAAAAGASIAHRGECSPVCGGIAGIPCDEGEFCDLPPGHCGSADLEGRCVEVSDACPEVHAPVCGCDGVTYDNDCFRQAARAQKDKDGPCECIPETAACETTCDCYDALGTAFCDDCPLLCPSCGNYWQCKEGACVEQCGIFPPDIRECVEPRCASNGDCGDAEYCAKPLGGCEGTGRCEPRPTACPDVHLPVCGCDGTTYGNRCDAAAAGVSVAHEGECTKTCGGIVGEPCPEGFVCELPAGHCDTADLQGRCVEKPEVCPDLYRPVCGCDGVTYGNDCERRQKGIQKEHDGPCECDDICCPFGSRSVDVDADLCADACEPVLGCASDADCHPDFGRFKVCIECPQLCPTCGPYLACEDGVCVERCRTVPPAN
jgi:hypothetical protein